MGSWLVAIPQVEVEVSPLFFFSGESLCSLISWEGLCYSLGKLDHAAFKVQNVRFDRASRSPNIPGLPAASDSTELTAGKHVIPHPLRS